MSGRGKSKYFFWKGKSKRENVTQLKPFPAHPSKSENPTSHQPAISKFFAPKSSSSKRSLGDSEEAPSSAKKPRSNVDGGGADVVGGADVGGVTGVGGGAGADVSLSENTKQKLDGFQQTNYSTDDFEMSTSVPSPINRSIHRQNGQSVHPSDKDESLSTVDVDAKPTPLEKQVIALKKKYPMTVLMIECGYWYRFFGDDAETAARILDITCHRDRMFMCSRVPTFNGPSKYIRKLVQAGFKVGVISQLESAATKKLSEGNKSGTFERDLTGLYTNATLIGDDFSAMSETQLITEEENVNKFILALKEGDGGLISFAAVDPSSGRMTWDSFSDGKTRSSLCARLVAIQPLEIVLCNTSISSASKIAVETHKQFASDFVRIEQMAASHFDKSSLFCGPHESVFSSQFRQSLPHLPPSVVECFAALTEYLKHFGMNRIVGVSEEIKQYSVGDEAMTLTAVTLQNLDVFQTQNELKRHGSLFWFLNQTLTRFGGRLLSSWVRSPLRDIAKIRERQAAILDLIDDDTDVRILLNKLPDLEMALVAALNMKISPKDFFKLFQTIERIQRNVTQVMVNTNYSSALLKLHLLPDVQRSFRSGSDVLESLVESAAMDNDKTKVFKDWSASPKVLKRKQSLEDTERVLDDHKTDICKALGLVKFEYVTVSGSEYLIEVKNKMLNGVPKTWTKISSTQKVSRFRSPLITEQLTKLQHHRDLLETECQQAWTSFLEGFTAKFHELQTGVRRLAELDCLMSLSIVSRQEGFCRPSFNTDRRMEVKNGRNPLIERFLPPGAQFVPNDIELDSVNSSMVLTGPNMGGKSSYLRQVGLISIMAQIGCFVPAESANLPIFDGIFVRMGARDDLMNRKSTLLVELEEASDILRKATTNSLVLVDELGRGTSTHDGFAIAISVFRYLINRIKSFNIFVTHFKDIADVERVEKRYMSYATEGSSDVSFLYKLVSGTSPSSFGINVARLAGIPNHVLESATEKSEEAERRSRMGKTFIQMMQSGHV